MTGSEILLIVNSESNQVFTFGTSKFKRFLNDEGIHIIGNCLHNGKPDDGNTNLTFRIGKRDNVYPSPSSSSTHSSMGSPPGPSASMNSTLSLNTSPSSSLAPSTSMNAINDPNEIPKSRLTSPLLKDFVPNEFGSNQTIFNDSHQRVSTCLQSMNFPMQVAYPFQSDLNKMDPVYFFKFCKC